MSTSVFYRRRAERLAQSLDEAGGARRHHAHSRTARTRADDELAELTALSHRLGTIEFDVKADPEFRSGLRAMLMATMERDGIGATAVDPEATREVPTARHRKLALPRIDVHDTPPRRRIGGAAGIAGALAAGSARPWYAPVRSRRARGAIVVGLAAGTLAVSGMSAASGTANPGDTLYTVKRSTERAQLALAGSDRSRGQLYLVFASTRMNEALAIRNDPTGLADVLVDMDTDTRDGVRLLTSAAVGRHDAVALDVVDAFVASQIRALDRLPAGLPAIAVDQVKTSGALLADISERTVALRASLSCPAGSQNAPAESQLDSLGPQPGRCVTQPTTPSRPVPTPTSNGRPSTTGVGGGTHATPPAAAVPTPSSSISTPPSPTQTASGSTGGGLVGDVLSHRGDPG